jgi:glycosyltransferase involved in cell wall biosynthesis
MGISGNHLGINSPHQPPQVSVLVPVYNGDEFLAEAIDSVLAQTLHDFELIVVDDGSTDGTQQILREIEERDERLRVFLRPHLGYVRQLNFGLDRCRGEFVARMDADDVAYPDRFQVQIDYLRQHPEVLVVGGAYDLTDARGRMLRRHWPPSDDATLQEMCLSGQTPIGHPTAMIRRQAMIDVGGYDESLETAEDIDLWLRLGEKGKLACVDHPVIRYRQHDKSVSEQRAVEQAESIRLGCERAYLRRGLSRTFTPPPAWRPTGEQARTDFLLTYGWWAFNSAQRSTAIIYGFKAVQRRPLSGEPWSLLYASLLKPLPERTPHHAVDIGPMKLPQTPSESSQAA